MFTIEFYFIYRDILEGTLEVQLRKRPVARYPEKVTTRVSTRTKEREQWLNEHKYEVSEAIRPLIEQAIDKLFEQAQGDVAHQAPA